jgi:hypothetical protein
MPNPGPRAARRPSVAASSIEPGSKAGSIGAPTSNCSALTSCASAVVCSATSAIGGGQHLLGLAQIGARGDAAFSLASVR